MKALLILIFFFAAHCLSFGQTGPVPGEYSADQLVHYTTQVLGFDDLLVNGSAYRPEKLNAIGNPFFECPDADKAGLYIKGQHFANLNLLYDIASDHLVLSQPLNQQVSWHVLLRPEMIDSFIIGDFTFINPSNLGNTYNAPGYYEKIAGGKVIFLKKHKKTFLKIYDAENKGKYSDQQSASYLLDQRGLTNVNFLRSFLLYHAPYKKEIKTYLREHQIIYRKANPDQIRKLMKFCHDLTFTYP